MLLKQTVDLVEPGVLVDYLAFWQFSMLGLVAIFALIAIAVVVRVMPRREPVSDEERAEMATAPMSASQKGAWWGLLIGVATLAGLATLLTARGAVPVVYLYLMFGSIILVLMISQSAGVLLGHWIGRRHGQV